MRGGRNGHPGSACLYAVVPEAWLLCQNRRVGADNGAVDAGLQSLLVAAKRRFKCADCPATERLARETQDAAEARHDIASAIEARVWLGAGLAQQGQYATALRWLHDAIDLTDANALPLHAGRACNYIAVCHEELGDFATAVEWYESGLVQARRFGNREVEVYLLSDLADGWVTAGSTHKAMPLLDQAVDVARSVGDQAHEAWCLSARGCGKTLARALSYGAITRPLSRLRCAADPSAFWPRRYAMKARSWRAMAIRQRVSSD